MARHATPVPAGRPRRYDPQASRHGGPGLHRQSDGSVYLRNDWLQGTAHHEFFGNPLAGDFDGDGCDTVSVAPAEPQPGLRHRRVWDPGQAGLGAASFSYVFGNPGDVSFVGDFDGDGVDTIGLHRRSTGRRPDGGRDLSIDIFHEAPRPMGVAFLDSLARIGVDFAPAAAGAPDVSGPVLAPTWTGCEPVGNRCRYSAAAAPALGPLAGEERVLKAFAFSIDGLPAGSYRLTVESGDGGAVTNAFTVG